VETPGRRFWVATLSDGTVVGATALRMERPQPVSDESSDAPAGDKDKRESMEKKNGSSSSFKVLEEGQAELLRMTVSSK
jgi:hypothetical protein